jgi:circadian clock protein KaiC
MAASFICRGGAGTGCGLWITFQESASSLTPLFNACDNPSPEALPLDGAADPAAERCSRVHVLEYNPGREPVEKILLRAEQIIRDEGVDRVVIDSINDLGGGLLEEANRHEATLWFLLRLRALGVTTLTTQRLARVTGRNPLSEIAWAELADTIIYLGLVEIESRLEKVVSVLKHRGGPTEGDLRSIHYTPRGLIVSDRFVGLSGVLAGTALGRPKARIEEIFQPLYFIRDFLSMAQNPVIEADKRSLILENLSSETAQLIHLLSRYFDQPLPRTAPPGPVAPGQGGEEPKK